MAQTKEQFTKWYMDEMPWFQQGGSSYEEDAEKIWEYLTQPLNEVHSPQGEPAQSEDDDWKWSNVFQKWQRTRTPQPPQETVSQLSGEETTFPCLFVPIVTYTTDDRRYNWDKAMIVDAKIRGAGDYFTTEQIVNLIRNQLQP